MRYEYSNTVTIEANTPQEICQALWQSMRFQMYETLEEWLKHNAKCCHAWDGKEYSDASYEAHVADLLKHGALKPMP